MLVAVDQLCSLTGYLFSWADPRDAKAAGLRRETCNLLCNEHRCDVVKH